MATKTFHPIITDDMERQADSGGIKLEFVNGIPVWEAFPLYRHQKKIDQTRASLKSTRQGEGGCKCISVADLTILFPDGSIKRPDISIFCQEPEESNDACTQIPEAVIEIISKGYEKKDLEISLPFYLSQGIADIVIFDPATNRVSHFHQGVATEYDSPVELFFACGCRAVL